MKLKSARYAFLSAIILIVIALFAACDAEPRKTDAELGLNQEQAYGRRVYDARCAEFTTPTASAISAAPAWLGYSSIPI